MKQTLNVVGTPPGKLDVTIELEADFEQQASQMAVLASEIDGEQVTLAASYANGKVTIKFTAETDRHKDHVVEQAEAASVHAVERDSIDRGEIAQGRFGTYDGPLPDHAAAPLQQKAATAGFIADAEAANEAEATGAALDAATAAKHEMPGEPSAADLDAVAEEQKAAEATGQKGETVN